MSASKKFWANVRQDGHEPSYPDDSPEARLRAFLWGQRIKATDIRMSILKLLSKESAPLSAADIAKKLDRAGAPATVHRAIDRLNGAGLVEKVELRRGYALYEITWGRKHHHHAVCTACGDIEDVTGCTKDALDALSSGLKKFRRIDAHALEFFGLCKKCEPKASKQ